MKTETHQADIDKRNAVQAASDSHKAAMHSLQQAILVRAAAPNGTVPTEHLERAVLATSEKTKAEDAWNKIPKQRREAVDTSLATAKMTMRRVANLLPELSGEVSTEYGLGKYLSVCCRTSHGEKYSRSCKYSKTDGHLKVILTAQCVLSLQAHEQLAGYSAAEELPLLSVERVEMDTEHDGVFRCVWPRKARGWDAVLVHGWIAMSGNTIYHSEASAQAAASGLRKKLNSSPQNGSLSHCEQITRRAIRDVTGWCGPGVQAWIERYLPAEHTRRRAVPREVVLESARKDTSTYGTRLVALLTK